MVHVDFELKRPYRDGFLFRLVEAADCAPLHRACYAERPFAEFEGMFRRSLKRQAGGQGYHLLVLDQGVIVGNAQLIRQGKRGEVADVVVTAARRNEGIGTVLIGLLEQIAAQKGWRPIEIGVTAENVRAQALYERLGYLTVREMKLPEGGTAMILQKE